MTPREKAELDLKLTEVAPETESGSEAEDVHLSDFLILLAKRKLFIFKFVGIVFALAVAVSLLLPVYYTGEAKIMPPQQSQSIAAAMLGDLGQLGGLVGASAGKDLGLKNPSDLYVAMLRSRTVADDLVDRFSLMSLYHKKLRVDARNRLEDLTDIRAGKDGMISISVDDRDPKRAADMANAYVDELEKLTKTLAVTDAGKRRVFFEREVKAASEDLANAEQALKQTEETTGIIQLDNQARVMLESYADLRAQVAAKEVQIQAMRTFATPENPELVRAEQELAALRAQVSRYERGVGGSAVGDIALERVPAKALEYVRKLRDVKYREALLQLLLKQYEAARIDEGREAAIIQMLDKALPPEKKSWPVRWVIILSVTVLALLLAILWVRLAELWERAKEDPQSHARMQLLKFYLSRWRKSEMMGRN